jgi:uroporphyrinogen-III synthase
MTDCLKGCRIVVTRPENQSEALCERLHALGAEPIRFPVIAIAAPEPGGALDQALGRIGDYDWIIFTSVNGVEHFWTRLAARQGKREAERVGLSNYRGMIAAIGPATAAALEHRGAAAHLMPTEYRAEAILDAIGDVDSLHILLPRADVARAELARGLRERGAHVDEVAAYRTVPATPSPSAFEELRRGVDILTFTSSSTVRNFVALTADLSYGDPLVACIGPVTADTARQVGLRVDMVAEDYTTEGLVDALGRLWKKNV